MSAVEIYRYSPAEYLELEREAAIRHELVNGELVAMAGGSEAHTLLAGNFLTELNIALRDRCCRVYGSDMKVAIEATGLYTYPDVSALCGDPQFQDARRDVLLNPSIIVEVLSPSTEAYDRGAKFAHYRKLASLQEYVLVAQDRPQVEVFKAAGDGTWHLREYQGLGVLCQLDSLNVALRLADIYRQLKVGDP